MNILFELDHAVAPAPLLVEVTLTAGSAVLYTTTVDLSTVNTQLDIVFDIQVPQQLTLALAVQDSRIVHYTLTVTRVVLDEFYSIDKILHSGHAGFDDNFLAYAQDNQIVLDSNITDTNRLDFTGQLVYYFEWPFYKNIFTNFRSRRIHPTKTQ